MIKSFGERVLPSGFQKALISEWRVGMIGGEYSYRSGPFSASLILCKRIVDSAIDNLEGKEGHGTV